MKTEELMIRDKQSGHRMSGWGRRRVIRGGSWGQGQLGGSAVVPSPPFPLPFNLKCGDTSTGSSSIGVKFEDKTTLIGHC